MSVRIKFGKTFSFGAAANNNVLTQQQILENIRAQREARDIEMLQRDIEELENFRIEQYRRKKKRTPKIVPPRQTRNTQFGGQMMSRITNNRLAPIYERVTGRDYPWYYYMPESHDERSIRLERAAQHREDMAEQSRLAREHLFQLIQQQRQIKMNQKLIERNIKKYVQQRQKRRM